MAGTTETLRFAQVTCRSMAAAARFYHDWSADPFSRGAYSYLGAGFLDAPGELAKPIADTLYFAGEATAPHGKEGMVHGAIASGLRAARQVQKRF